MHKNLASILLTLILGTTGVAEAGVSVQDEIQSLRSQLEALTARLEQLEQATAGAQEGKSDSRQGSSALAVVSTGSPVPERSDPSPAAGSWTDRLRWQGDFRFRYENIDLEDAEDRNRMRIRARAAMIARLAEDLEVGFGLATAGLDPVSANVTLGGGGGAKDINLDLAYFTWRGLPGTRITGGKFKQIIRTAAGNQMLWDSDWRPEGFGVQWDGQTLFASAEGTWLESDSALNTQFSWIAQAGAKLELAETATLTLAAGYHEFETRGRSSFFDNDMFQGNSFDPDTETYLYNYNGIQAFAELDSRMFGLPLKLYGEFVDNQDAPEHNRGYIVGVELGNSMSPDRSSVPGSWGVSWYYEDLEADATLGLLTNSDFGLSGTDVSGHVFQATYQLRRQVSANFAYYLNEVGEDIGLARDVDRVQLDLNFLY